MTLKHVIVLLSLVGLSACIKTDLDLISDKLLWTPDVSFPIAQIDAALSADEVSKLPPGNIPTIEIQETVEFDFPEMFKNREHVKKLSFRFNITNAFPYQGQVRIYFQDAAGNNLTYGPDVGPIIVDKGKVDDQGKPTIPAKMQHDEELSDDLIDLLASTNQLLIKIWVLNVVASDQLGQYSLQAKIGVQAQIEKEL